MASNGFEEGDIECREAIVVGFSWITDVSLARAWSMSSTILTRSSPSEGTFAKWSSGVSRSFASANGIQSFAV